MDKFDGFWRHAPPRQFSAQPQQDCHEKFDLMAVVDTCDSDIVERDNNVLSIVAAYANALVENCALPAHPRQGGAQTIG